jgi:hypothetical protein
VAIDVPKVFTQSQLQAIADALGDTSEGLTASEIGHLLGSCKMFDSDPGMTKRHRLYNAFAHSQNASQDRLGILAFIRKSMRPELYARSPERYEPMRATSKRWPVRMKQPGAKSANRSCSIVGG